MSHIIPGGETDSIKLAADRAADLAIDIRYKEGESNYHIHSPRDVDFLAESHRMVLHHRSAEYGAKIALSALLSMDLIPVDFDTERFTQEVAGIREQMGMEVTASRI